MIIWKGEVSVRGVSVAKPWDVFFWIEVLAGSMIELEQDGAWAEVA